MQWITTLLVAATFIRANMISKPSLEILNRVVKHLASDSYLRRCSDCGYNNSTVLITDDSGISRCRRCHSEHIGPNPTIPQGAFVPGKYARPGKDLK